MPNAVPTPDIDPFSDAVLADPYAYHDALREAGPVFWLEHLGVYGMARFDEVRASLLDHETFVSSRGVGLADFAKEEPWRPPSLLLEADPPLHDRTRGIMSAIFAPARLRENEPMWRERARQLVDELTESDGFDAVTDLAEVYPMRVFPDAVGLMDEGREHLLTYAAAVFNAFGPRNHIFEEGNAASLEASAWVAEACKRDNLKPGGWGQEVFAAADRGECTPDEAERLVRSLLSAGVDTTVNGIGHLLLAFTAHPHEWDKLRADPRLIRRAVAERCRSITRSAEPVRRLNNTLHALASLRVRVELA